MKRKSELSARYFSELNYTLANEDTALELAVLPERVGHVLAVAGSGSRVLPLLAKAPKLLTCVDLSAAQLMLVELRVESLRALDHDGFLAFWGYPPRVAEPAERRAAFRRLALTDATRAFFQGAFDELEFAPLLYRGRWERTFQKLCKVTKFLCGDRGARLFDARTDDDYRHYLETEFPRRAFSGVLLVVGNAAVFNALLYKGDFPTKNIPGSHFSFYRAVFDRLFAQGPARENFFLQLCFFGEVRFAEGCPVECRADVFAKAKAALGKTKVRYEQGDVLARVQQSDEPIDFLSLSDVPSYWSGPRERSFLQDARGSLADGAHVVVRSYLHIPRGLRRDGYVDVTSDYHEAIAREKMQVYSVEVVRRRPD